MFTWAGFKEFVTTNKLLVWGWVLLYWIQFVPDSIAQNSDVLVYMAIVSVIIGVVFIIAGSGLSVAVSMFLYKVYRQAPETVHNTLGQPSVNDNVLRLRSHEKPLDGKWTKLIVDDMPWDADKTLVEFMKENGTYSRYYISTMEAESEELSDMVDALGKSEVYIEDDELAFLYKMTH